MSEFRRVDSWGKWTAPDPDTIKVFKCGCNPECRAWMGIERMTEPIPASTYRDPFESEEAALRDAARA